MSNFRVHLSGFADKLDAFWFVYLSIVLRSQE